jgi:diguanylate cyclase (GGDEF)-like protein
VRIPSPAMAVVLLLAAPLASHAQTPAQAKDAPELPLPDRPHYVFQRVGEQLGLGSVTPSSILQDQLGFIWIGTRDGLLRYDGAHVVHYGIDQGLPGTDVEEIVQAPNGRIWIVTRKGLAFYEGNALHVFKLPDEYKQIDAVQALAVDADGVPYLATLNGLLRLDTAKGKISETWGQADGLPAPEVDAVTVGPDGRVWIGSDHRVGWLDAEDHLQFFPAEAGLPREKIVTILRDSQRVLWVRTVQGLYRLDKSNTHFVKDEPADLPPANDFGRSALDHDGNLLIPSVLGMFRRVNGEWELLDQSRGMFANATFTVTEDREGAYWIGLGGAGIQRWMGRKSWSGWTQNEGLPDNVVWVEVRDSQKRLWVGTNNGLAMWDTQQHRWRVWKAKDGLNGSTVRDMTVTGDGAVWVLCVPGGLTRFDPISLQPEKVATPEPLPGGISRGVDGKLWIGSSKYLMAMEPQRPFRFVDVPVPAGMGIIGSSSRIVLGPDNVMWLCGHSGMARFDGHSWTHFAHGDGLMEDEVDEVAPVNANEVWVDYGDAMGASRVRIVDGKAQVSNFGLAQGLAGLEIYMLGADRDGNVWAGGEHGLTEFLKNGSALRFTRSDGLIWNDLSSGGFHEEEDGTLLFGTSGGLARYNPFVAENSRDVAPSVVITAARLGSRDRVREGNPKAVHDDNTLSVEFAALTYRDPENVRCVYRLDGLETEFTETTSREVRYPALPPGRYRFDVACRSSRGTASVPAHFAFAVEPAWWEEWYTRGAGILLGIFALLGVIRNRTKQLERERLRLEKAVAERSAALAEANRVLEEMTLTDPLTSVRNRRYFQVTIAADVGQAIRGYVSGDNSRTKRNRDLIFYLIDADHFKEINDRFGHDAGDQVLIEMTRRISSAIRHSDVLVRWGGEEFLVVSRFTERKDAVALAARVLGNVAREPFDIRGAGISLHRTCSIGWAAFPWDTNAPESVSYEDVLGLADRALYEAKRSGRNQAMGAVLAEDGALVGAPVGGAGNGHTGKAGVAASYLKTPGIVVSDRS